MDSASENVWCSRASVKRGACITECSRRRRFTEAPLHLLNLLVPEAIRRVIVDHARRLHQGITNRRADELEAALDHVLAHRVGFFRFGRNIGQRPESIDDWFAADKLPQVTIERAELLLSGEKTTGVDDGGVDFEFVSNDAGVFEQTRNVPLGVTGNFLRIEAVECLTIVLSLQQYRTPAQARL